MSADDDVNRTNEEILRRFQEEIEAPEKQPPKKIAEFMTVRNSRLEDWMSDALLHGMTLDVPEKPVIQAIISMLLSALLTVLVGVGADKDNFMRTFSRAWDLKKKLEKKRTRKTDAPANASDEEEAQMLPKVEVVSADDDEEMHELLKKLTPNRFI